MEEGELICVAELEPVCEVDAEPLKVPDTLVEPVLLELHEAVWLLLDDGLC